MCVPQLPCRGAAPVYWQEVAGARQRQVRQRVEHLARNPHGASAVLVLATLAARKDDARALRLGKLLRSSLGVGQPVRAARRGGVKGLYCRSLAHLDRVVAVEGRGRLVVKGDAAVLGCVGSLWGVSRMRWRE